MHTLNSQTTWQDIKSAPLYSAQQIKQLDKLTAKEQGISSFSLMQKAAYCALNCLIQHYPKAQKLCFFAGQGNNGGDALMMATYAQQLNFQVQVYLIEERNSSTNQQQAKQLAQAAGVPIHPLKKYQKNHNNDVIIDGLLGIGLQGSPQGEYAHAIELINTQSAPVFSLDLPSGLEADSGNGATKAIQATHSITFIAHKIGLLTGAAKQAVGQLFYANLGCTTSTQQQLPAKAYAYQYADIKPILQKRKSHAHKGHFGHLFLAGGNQGMGGAIILASMLGARTGVGKLSCLTHKEHISPLLMRCPEIMSQKFTQKQPTDRLFKASTAIAIGPGLGQDLWAIALLNSALQSRKPCVLDADALNLLAHQKINLHTDTPYILTPHTQEAARLLETNAKEIEQNRLQAAERLAQKYHAIVVLKGAGSIIASYDKTQLSYLCLDGQPSMAKAGMGDALTGIIGGFLAQGMPAFTAAYKAVCVHAKAAELATKNHGEAGLLAQDLSTHIGRLISP